MYTYLRPREEELPTRSSIRRRGSLELYHALDVKRLVAFIGSGVSAAYGRPSWTELVRILLRVTAETLRQQARQAQPRTTQQDGFDALVVRELLHETCDILGVMVPRAARAECIASQVWQDTPEKAFESNGSRFDKAELSNRVEIHAMTLYLEQDHDFGEISITNLLELCETLVGKSGEPKVLRKAIEWTFRRDGHIAPRLFAAGLLKSAPVAEEGGIWTRPHLDEFGKAGAEANSDVFAQFASSAGVAISETDADWLSRATRNPSFEKFAYLSLLARILPDRDDPLSRHLRAIDGQVSKSDLYTGGEIFEDPLYEMRETLGIRRFLTINYDFEFERFLNERLGYRDADNDVGNTQASKRMRDGFGGFAEVSNATEDELGQLVAFASVSNPSGVHVLHLHGQSASPESIVLTEADYQRRYLGKTARRRSFHEALEALFVGNSVLFVGVGMNEADLLQPFRQFASVTRENTALRGPRHGKSFALLPFQDNSRSSAKALELDQTYGVSSRFYGETIMRELQALVGTIRQAARRHLVDEADCDATDWKARLETELAALRDAVTAVQGTEKSLEASVAAFKQAGESLSDPAVAAVLFEAMREIAARPQSLRKRNLSQLEATAIATLYGLACEGAVKPDGEDGATRDRSWRLLDLFFDRLSSDIQSRALCAELRRVAESRHRWAREWGTTPMARRAIFRNISRYEDQPLWSRHQIDLHPIEGAEASELVNNPVYSGLQKLARDSDLQKLSGRRILRAAIPRGGGKGSALRALTESLQTAGEAEQRLAATIFPAVGADDPETPQAYRGAFITHSNFLTEYGTVSAAFYRFLRVAMMQGFGVDTLPNQEPAAAAGEIGDIVDDASLLEPSERLVLVKGAKPRRVDYVSHDGVSAGGVKSYDYIEEEDEPLLGGVQRLPLLRAAMHRLVKLSPTAPGHRWLMVLTGVDRLCEAGVPVSSTIGNFFRTLTDHRFAELPFDILLLSGDTDFGIWGLSAEDEEASKAAAADSAGKPGSRKGRKEKKQKPRAPWPVLRSSLEDGFIGRPWRLKGDTTPLGRDVEFLKQTHWGPRDFPELTATMARYRVIDCWVMLLLRDLLNSRGEERDPGAKPDPDRLPRILENMNDAVRGDRIHRLVDQILSIRGRVERLDQKSVPSWAALKELVLRHLSLITIPVERGVILSLPEVERYLNRSLKEATNLHGSKFDWVKNRKSDWGNGAGNRIATECELKREALSQCLRELVNAGLVIPVEARNPLLDDGEADRRFGVHSVLRQCVTRKMNLPLRDLAQRNLYDVSVHDILPRDLPTPGHPEFREIASLVTHLIEVSRKQIEPWIRWTEAAAQTEKDRLEKQRLLDEFDAEAFHATSRRLRACFSILHGVLSIGAIARLDRLENVDEDNEEPPFEAYRGMIRALLNATTALDHIKKEAGFRANPEHAHSRNRYGDRAALLKLQPDSDLKTHHNWPKVMSAIKRMREPLHLSEIVWLYNERALISFLQGRMFDSRSLFELARQKATSAAIHLPLRENPTARRIHLSRALVLLEGGRIEECRRELEVLKRESAQNIRVTGESYQLAKGYLGLCAHLEGRFDTAARAYTWAISHFEDRHNLRAVANFSRLYADLLRRDKKFDEAAMKIDRARIAAARQEHRDLLHHALISHARLLRDMNEPREAARLLRKAEEYAISMGSYKIAADSLRCLAELMLGEGETEFAGRLAVEAMAITSVTGMRLRKIASVILYGEVLLARDQPLYARPILRQALYDSERCGYQLKASRAAELLHDVEIQLSAAGGLADRPEIKSP